MQSAWKTESGHIARRWAEAGDYASYAAEWMDEAAAAEGSYLEPVPDFASHSPFGGPQWFEPQSTRRVPQ
jgi:hypothetical protein